MVCVDSSRISRERRRFVDSEDDVEGNCRRLCGLFSNHKRMAFPLDVVREHFFGRDVDFFVRGLMSSVLSSC